MLSAPTLSYRNPLWKSAVRPVTLADLRPPSQTGPASYAQVQRHLAATFRICGIGSVRAERVTPIAVASGEVKLPYRAWSALAIAIAVRWPRDPHRPILGGICRTVARRSPELLALPRHRQQGTTWRSAAPRHLPILARLASWAIASAAIGAPVGQDSAPPLCGDPGASQGHCVASPQGAVQPLPDHVEPPLATTSGGAPLPAPSTAPATGPLEAALARSRARRTKPAP